MALIALFHYRYPGPLGQVRDYGLCHRIIRVLVSGVRFQVSVKSESWEPVGVKQKTQRSLIQGHLMSDLDPMGLHRLLTPDT